MDKNIHPVCDGWQKKQKQKTNKSKKVMFEANAVSLSKEKNMTNPKKFEKIQKKKEQKKTIKTMRCLLRNLHAVCDGQKQKKK